MALTCSIDDFLMQAQLAIENALDHPQLLARLSDFGYDETRLREGRQRYEGLQAAVQRQQQSRGHQVAATEAFKVAWKTAKQSYMPLVKIARIAFKDRSGIATELALAGARKQALPGWLAQANQFYTNALGDEEILAGLKGYGITVKRLKVGQAQVNAVAAASAVQNKRKGETQTATQKRAVALDELRGWISDFRAVAKIAMEGEEQLLEVLGMVQRR